MNFRRQVRFARKWGGLGLLLFGVPFGISEYRFETTGFHFLPKAMFLPMLIGLFFALVLLLFGGIGRPVHRAMWLYFFRESMSPYTGKPYDQANLGLFTLWVGDTDDYEDRE